MHKPRQHRKQMQVRRQDKIVLQKQVPIPVLQLKGLRLQLLWRREYSNDVKSKVDSRKHAVLANEQIQNIKVAFILARQRLGLR